MATRRVSRSHRITPTKVPPAVVSAIAQLEGLPCHPNLEEGCPALCPGTWTAAFPLPRMQPGPRLQPLPPSLAPEIDKAASLHAPMQPTPRHQIRSPVCHPHRIAPTRNKKRAMGQLGPREAACEAILPEFMTSSSYFWASHAALAAPASPCFLAPASLEYRRWHPTPHLHRVQRVLCQEKSYSMECAGWPSSCVRTPSALPTIASAALEGGACWPSRCTASPTEETRPVERPHLSTTR